jgi:hypothetical protein
MAAASYEFTAQQNEIFKGLVRNMKRSGVVVAIASVILLAYNLSEHYGVSLGGERNAAVHYVDLALWCLLSVVGVVIAILLVRATAAFTAVIHTEGDDVEHLMQGLTRLVGILQLVFLAAIAGSVLLAVSFVLLLFYS